MPPDCSPLCHKIVFSLHVRCARRHFFRTIFKFSPTFKCTYTMASHTFIALASVRGAICRWARARRKSSVRATTEDGISQPLASDKRRRAQSERYAELFLQRNKIVHLCRHRTGSLFLDTRIRISEQAAEERKKMVATARPYTSAVWSEEKSVYLFTECVCVCSAKGTGGLAVYTDEYPSIVCYYFFLSFSIY